MATNTANEALKAWVREHQVVWEIAPHIELHRQRRVQVGFDLTLRAKRGAHAVGPADEASVRAFETLVEIAHRVVPRGARVDQEPFDSSFHLRPETHWEPETELVVEILHHTGTFEALDQAERGYASVIERRLQELGVQHGIWRPSRNACPNVAA